MLSEDTPAIKKRRGAPRGNTNALKHGFYSRRFKHIELKDLETVGDYDLDDEIAMLRVVMRRLIESTPEDMAFPDAIKFLRVISISSANLSRLMRLRQVIAENIAENTEYVDPLAAVVERLNRLQAAGGTELDGN